MSTVRAIFRGCDDSARVTLTLPQAGAIAVAYGDVLSTRAPPVGAVADAADLPFPKSVIKRALITLLGASLDPESRACLTTAYLCLADWQERVQDGGAGLAASAVGRRGGALNQTGETRSRTQQSDLWQKSAEEERERLQAELQELGLLSRM